MFSGVIFITYLTQHHVLLLSHWAKKRAAAYSWELPHGSTKLHTNQPIKPSDKHYRTLTNQIKHHPHLHTHTTVPFHGNRRDQACSLENNLEHKASGIYRYTQTEANLQKLRSLTYRTTQNQGQCRCRGPEVNGTTERDTAVLATHGRATHHR